MNALAWLLRLLFFLVILWFALKNTMPVTVRLTETLRWDEVPLVLVMLGCLLVGMLLGAMALAPRLYRMHRRAAAAQLGAQRVRSAPPEDVDVGGDRLANVARRAGAVGELDVADTAGAPPRR
jgi:lipopolysaccharide assembly protein A